MTYTILLTQVGSAIIAVGMVVLALVIIYMALRK